MSLIPEPDSHIYDIVHVDRIELTVKGVPFSVADEWLKLKYSPEDQDFVHQALSWMTQASTGDKFVGSLGTIYIVGQTTYQKQED